jgi:hypothetical protein
MTDHTAAADTCDLCGEIDHHLTAGVCDTCAKTHRFFDAREGDAPAAQPAPVQEPEYCDPSTSVYKLVEMVMFDCGHSTNNQRLLDRIADRIQRHIGATTPPAAQPAAQSEWVAVSDRLPRSNVIVLAHYKNSHGHNRRIRAEWAQSKTLEASDNWDGDAEYDEATDTYYCPQGWYERIDNWDEFSSIAVHEGEITHWMPMPAAPQQEGGAV